MGKVIYRVADMGYPYVHVDDRVHEVTPDTIPEIEIDKDSADAGRIDPDGFFSVERILEGL